MTNLHQHGLNRAIIGHLRKRFEGVRVDLVFDGYEMPSVRPLITIEPMQNNYEMITKQREAVQAIYRYQIGLHDVNSAQLSINQERMQNVFLFDEIEYYDTLGDSPTEIAGYFLCELTAVTPLPADDISKKSEYNRVYFDVEIEDIKRRC